MSNQQLSTEPGQLHPFESQKSGRRPMSGETGLDHEPRSA
jgi:hypothetical protein